MKRSISIIGSILLAAALTSPAWAHPGNGKGGGGAGAGGGGGGEPQKGGLPALEDRVEADEALIATLQTQVSTLMSEVTVLQGAVSTLQGQVADLEGQNNFALVDETTTTCTLGASHSSAGPVSAAFFSNGVCLVTFAENVSLCSSVATLAGGVGGEIAVSPTTKTITGDTLIVSTFDSAGTAAASDFNLTVTCP